MGSSASERNALCGHVVAHQVEERVRRRVLDDERLARGHHLLDLGVLAEVDGQVPQLLVVAGGDHVADVALVPHQDDAAPIDARHLGDAAHHGEEDVAEVEGGRERLGELEHHLGVALLAAQGLDVLAHAELPADAGHQLDRAEGLADEVVGARLEGAGHVVVRVERGEHHHRDVGGARIVAERAQHRESVRRRHHQIEQHQRRRALGQPRQRVRAGIRRRRCPGPRTRAPERARAGSRRRRRRRGPGRELPRR